MTEATSIDVSLVLAVGDVEEGVGREIRAAASHFRALGLNFEIVAVNDGSRDNTLAILALLQTQMPELRVVRRDVSGRAFVRGAGEAHGDVVVLATCAGAGDKSLPWAPLGWALRRLEAGQDAVVLRGRYIVARRLPSLPAIARSRGSAAAFERRFEREALDLAIEVAGTRARPSIDMRGLGEVRDFVIGSLRRLALMAPRH